MLTQDDILVIEDIVEEKTRLLPTKEEFFSKMDEVMGELKTIRETFDLHTGQHTHLNDQLDDHDTRITKIEKSTPASV